MRKIIFYILFAVWLVLWAWFLVRDIFLKGNIKSYKILLTRSLEGRRSYVTGDSLYEFLAFCNKNLPEGSGYSLMGPEKGSIDRIRAGYYLYPRIETSEPQYILVYGAPDIKVKGYGLLVKLDDNRYILRKVEPTDLSQM